MPDPTPPSPSSATTITRHVRIEAVDWVHVFDGLHLLASFRMAIQPGKLLLSFMLVVLLYLGGLGMDVIWGRQVRTGELTAYSAMTTTQYTHWLAERGEVPAVERSLIFETVVRENVNAFGELLDSGSRLEFGLSEVLTGRGTAGEGVIGAIVRMIVIVPGWLYHTHPGFLALYLLYAFLLTAALGGGVARLAAVDACRGLKIGAFAALRYALQRYHWLIAGPVIVAVVIFGIGLTLALAGLVLFNVPGLDIIGGLLFVLMLAGGFVASLLLVGLVVAMPLMPSAIAVEGADAFDAISRSFNYTLGRPLRWLVYNAIVVVYGALTYVLVLTLVVLTVWFTREYVGWWPVGELPNGQTRFDLIMPEPGDSSVSRFVYQIDRDALDATGEIAATLVGVWVRLLVLVLPAYAVSYFFCSQTWVYLLLRRAADGTGLNEMGLGAEVDPGDGLASLASRSEVPTGDVEAQGGA